MRDQDDSGPIGRAGFVKDNIAVFYSDLIDRGCRALIQNFYSFARHNRPSRAVVTNPPFGECNRDPGWVRHALETLDLEYLALLLPINWLGAAGRAKLWADFPPARIYVMRWRIDWTNQGASPMLNIWVVLDRAHTGETIMRMLDRPKEQTESLFDGTA